MREASTFGKQKLNEQGISKDILKNVFKIQNCLRTKDKSLSNSLRSKCKRQRMKDKPLKSKTQRKENK